MLRRMIFCIVLAGCDAGGSDSGSSGGDSTSSDVERGVEGAPCEPFCGDGCDRCAQGLECAWMGYPTPFSVCGRACQQHDECAQGETCTQGTCVTECRYFTGCPYGLACIRENVSFCAWPE